METLDLSRVLISLQGRAELIGADFVQTLHDRAPVGPEREGREGHLQDSFSSGSSSDSGSVTVTISTDDDDVYRWVTEGTSAHPIDPRHPKEALYWPGADHPYAHVNHPGTAPNPFVDDAMNTINDLAEQAVDAAVADAFGD